MAFGCTQSYTLSADPDLRKQNKTENRYEERNCVSSRNGCRYIKRSGRTISLRQASTKGVFWSWYIGERVERRVDRLSQGELVFSSIGITIDEKKLLMRTSNKMLLKMLDGTFLSELILLTLATENELQKKWKFSSFLVLLG